MTYGNRGGTNVVEPPIVNQNPVVDYHDRVRWGPIFGGIAIAIAAQLMLSALGVAIGLTVGAAGADATTIGWSVGIWSIISLLIALFIGGWVMARTCGPMNKKTALLNGAILWATTIAISSWLLASGVSGTFGIVAANANMVNQMTVPSDMQNVTPAEAQALVGELAQAGWSFLFGSLLGLIAAMIGASVGARHPRTQV
jgi:hypothetical protein